MQKLFFIKHLLKLTLVFHIDPTNFVKLNFKMKNGHMSFKQKPNNLFNILLNKFFFNKYEHKDNL